MGIYDTYNPCQKLKDIVIKETTIKDFDWQTKSLECELCFLDINENLVLIDENNKFYDLDLIDDPHINKGILLLEFIDGQLKSLLHINNPIETYGVVHTPDILIEFKNIDSYKVTRIYDFDYNCKGLIKRNFLYNTYLSN